MEKSVHPDVGTFKKMCRLLELKRRIFLEQDWKNCATELPRGQFNNLMMVRFAMPCNLSRIMSITGLTSAGASLFVDKLVQQGFLRRIEDPDDRRNVQISVTAKGQQLLNGVDDRLNEYIFRYFDNCSAEELEGIDQAMKIICSKLQD